MNNKLLKCLTAGAMIATLALASPVCGTKNFSSVRLYSAPQLHCTIVAIPANMHFGLSIFQPDLARLAMSRSRPPE